MWAREILPIFFLTTDNRLIFIEIRVKHTCHLGLGMIYYIYKGGETKC